MIDFNLLAALVVSTLIAYLMGALPIAAWVSRSRGVDIFSVGTGLPGASNVRRSVGNLPGGAVLFGDMAKGLISIVAARLMGLEGVWLLLPCFFMVLGHWKSIFTGFKGGDGVAPLGGAIIAMFAWNGFIAAAIAAVVTLGGQKLPYTSLLGTVAGIAALIWLSAIGPTGVGQELQLAVGVGFVAAMVLIHATVGHRRRNARTEWDDLDDLDIDDLDGPESVVG